MSPDDWTTKILISAPDLQARIERVEPAEAALRRDVASASRF
jgi:hypothetical protein